MTPTHRPIPDENLIKRAFRVLEHAETPMQKYLRDEHTAMISAARIGMDAARNLWPVDGDHIPASAKGGLVKVHELFEEAYSWLDSMAIEFHGELVHSALLGEDIRERLEAYEEKIWPGSVDITGAPALSPQEGAQPAESPTAEALAEAAPDAS